MNVRLRQGNGGQAPVQDLLGGPRFLLLIIGEQS
jgi:hypothetical protein